jgi:biotin transport system substrate-specific component
MTAEKSKSNKTQKLVISGLFVALIAVGAFIQIPVPYLDYFTLQFLFVLLAGMLLGHKLGPAAVAAYVAIGLIGIPIFAAGGGIGYVLRPSFGYLIGFIVAAFTTGILLKKRNTKYWHYLVASLGGFIVTYAIGIVYKYFILNSYLGEATPWSLVFLSCFPLDIPGDLLLCILAAGIGKRLNQLGLGKYKV